VLAFGAVISAAARQEKPPMADDVFKNIQVLRGLTVDEFMGTMGFISASLSMNRPMRPATRWTTLASRRPAE